MAKKPKPPARKKSLTGRTKVVGAKQAAKPPSKTGKSTGPTAALKPGKSGPIAALKTGKTGPVPALKGKSGRTAALTRENIHIELGAQLTAKRGDEAQERTAIATAIHAFMQLAIADGHPKNGSAYEAQCPEFFWEGDGKNPPVYARVPDSTHDEIGRWFKLIVEGVRAYDSLVGAVQSNAKA
jgi:hypothetical protein